MKNTNLNPLFIDLIRSYSHLITIENKTKNEFLQIIKNTYSLENQRNNLFYISCQKSEFETIKLTNDRNSIIFNN
jgi:hypothetical protein